VTVEEAEVERRDEEAEVERRDKAIAALPAWRRPIGVETSGLTSRELQARRQCELDGIRQALIDLACTTPQTAEELYIAVCEEWGDEPRAMVATVIAELVREGLFVRSDDGYELAPEEH
jgi:hypothetical protein